MLARLTQMLAAQARCRARQRPIWMSWLKCRLNIRIRPAVLSWLFISIGFGKLIF